MPRLLVHGIVGLPISILIVYVFNPFGVVIFFLLSLLVDLDHMVGYYLLTKDWTWNLKVEYGKVSKWWTETGSPIHAAGYTSRVGVPETLLDRFVDE